MSNNHPEKCTAAERALLDIIIGQPGRAVSVTADQDGRFSTTPITEIVQSESVLSRARAAFDFGQAVAPVDHDRAELSARRFIASRFAQPDGARITVPPKFEEDDDFVLLTYIRQRRALDNADQEKNRLRNDLGEVRTDVEIASASEKNLIADIDSQNSQLAELGWSPLGKGSAPLDEIFEALHNANILGRSGSVLLSPESTLKKSRVLFMGLNPGGDAEELSDSNILRNLASCRMEKSAWEELWKGEAGNSVLQRRFKYVAAFIGEDPLAMPATNAVFTRSRDVKSHQSWTRDRTATTSVHQILADTIQPEKLWFMGDLNAAGDLLTDQQIKWEKADHGDWYIGHGTAVYMGRPVKLCHTPHLSRWDPVGKDTQLRFAFGMTN